MNFDEKSSIYEKISISQKQGADILLSMLNINQKDKVIDIGCGTGYLTEQLSLIAKDTCGIDLSDKMIKEAKIIRPQLNFYVANGENFIQKNTYDLIVTNAVTYYFKNIENTFKNFYLSLKQNGYYALQAQTQITPQFTQALNHLLDDDYTKQFYIEYKLPIIQLNLEEFTKILKTIGFEMHQSKLINFKNEYTIEEALSIFKSGTATPLLNPVGYKQPLTEKYITKFWDIISESLFNQAINGKIILDVPRCFIIAKKCI